MNHRQRVFLIGLLGDSLANVPEIRAFHVEDASRHLLPRTRRRRHRRFNRRAGNFFEALGGALGRALELPEGERLALGAALRQIVTESSDEQERESPGGCRMRLPASLEVER
jgi:hypothetical protein